MGFVPCSGTCISATDKCVDNSGSGGSGLLFADPVSTGGTTGMGPTMATGGATSGAGNQSGAGGETGAAGASGGFGGNSCSPEMNGRGEPVAVAFAGDDVVLVQTREPATLVVKQLSTGVENVVTLSSESRADTGHSIFHSNSGGGLACASCHPEGHEDGRVWDFACEGPRRTQDPSGGLKGTEPFHWGGDLADFPTLAEAVFVQRMSGPELSREQTQAALSWINTVPSRSAARAATDPQVARGKALFNDPSVACASCHTGAAFTNNSTVSVGTFGMFQVPSLRGVGARAPYMHDGCAPTLGARFSDASCGGGDAHGHTSQLAPSQLDDLIAYLESI